MTNPFYLAAGAAWPWSPHLPEVFCLCLAEMLVPGWFGELGQVHLQRSIHSCTKWDFGDFVTAGICGTVLWRWLLCVTAGREARGVVGPLGGWDRPLPCSLVSLGLQMPSVPPTRASSTTRGRGSSPTT